MLKSNTTAALFQAAARQDTALNWYAIADSAQHKDLPTALLRNGTQSRCLLGAPQGSSVARYSPHLVSLESPLRASSVWSWINLNVGKCPCLSIIATRLTFDTLFRQFEACTEVIMPGGDTMFFAFWDPAILGTLVGQADDSTLYVKGPVLEPEQREMLVSMVALWCYWSRCGVAHLIACDNGFDSAKQTVISLNQTQVDALVEASVPDHILYFIELNHPNLVSEIDMQERYPSIRRALVNARELGLASMTDLVNYACIELIYKERMNNDSSIKNLLHQIKQGEIGFANSLNLFP